MNDQNTAVTAVTEPRADAALPAVPGAPLAPAPFDFAPKSLTEAMELSKLLAASSIVPKDYIDKPGNVLVAIQMGGELGLKPMAAMQNIAVINGRPSLWGDAVLALVRSARDIAGNKLLEGIEETFDEQTNTATCKVKRRGNPPKERTFSRQDAIRAGLLNKEIWKAYERRMLQMRARSWALRDEFTDVLKGMSIAEELMDYAPPEKDVTPMPGPSTPAEKSRSDKVLAERQEARVKAVCDAFDGARNDAELGIAVEKAQGLTDEGRKRAMEHYRKAKVRLTPPEATKEPDASEPRAPKETGAPMFTAAQLSEKLAACTNKDEADVVADQIRTLPAEHQAPLFDQYSAKIASFDGGK